MSLKFDIEEFPEKWNKEIVAAVEDYKNGKRNAKRKLRKFVNREISEHGYNELLLRYSDLYRKSKNIRYEEQAKKIKDVFLSSASLLVLFGSMSSALGDLIVRHGKGSAVLYFFLWLWSLNYAVSTDSKEISRLTGENNYLKDEISYYKGTNEKLKAKIEDISNNQ